MSVHNAVWTAVLNAVRGDVGYAVHSDVRYDVHNAVHNDVRYDVSVAVDNSTYTRADILRVEKIIQGQLS